MPQRTTAPKIKKHNRQSEERGWSHETRQTKADKLKTELDDIMEEIDNLLTEHSIQDAFKFRQKGGE